MGEPCATCGISHRVKTAEECLDGKMSEKILNDRVQDRARRRGWKLAHASKVETPQGWRTAMTKGWPDLFMMRERDSRVLVIELKRENEDPDEDQLAFLVLFNLCGISAVVVRPSNLRNGDVNAILD